MHSVRIGRNMYKLRPFAAPVLGEVLPSHTHCCAASGARARRSCTYSDRFIRSAVLQAERERGEAVHILTDSYVALCCKRSENMSYCLRCYMSSERMDVPMVPLGIATPKLSAMVAPMVAKVSRSSSLPWNFIDGEYDTNGTYSRV